MLKAILDTDIFSELAKGKNSTVAGRATLYVSRHRRLTISAVTVMEVSRGLHLKGSVQQRQFLQDRLKDLEIVPVTATIALLAGEIDARLAKSGRPIGAFDPLIAASAIEHDLDLVTGNEAHFGFIAELGFPLRVTNWRNPVS